MEITKYLILTALVEAPAHGTAIRAQIVGDTLGIYIADGTLYAALKSLKRSRLIEETTAAISYRREYQISSEGRRHLKLEQRMHRRIIDVLDSRLH